MACFVFCYLIVLFSFFNSYLFVVCCYCCDFIVWWLLDGVLGCCVLCFGVVLDVIVFGVVLHWQ